MGEQSTSVAWVIAFFRENDSCWNVGDRIRTRGKWI